MVEEISSCDSSARTALPNWALGLLRLDHAVQEREAAKFGGDTYVLEGGVLRNKALLADADRQVRDTFAYKWSRRDTFQSDAFTSANREWLVERYGDMSKAAWLKNVDGDKPVVLDAGCGAAFSAAELFSPVINRIRYLGADISKAVDVARKKIGKLAGSDAAFIQSDLIRLPLRESSVDVIFSEGVLHHTPDPAASLKALTKLLKPGGRFMFYVYRAKGPIREFTDDYIRDRLSDALPEDAWRKLEPLTRLGKVLGDLDIEIDVPEAIDLLEIPAGRISLQRLFYWHVMKLYYRPDYNLDEMNHVNFDWYTPRYARRQTVEQVRGWCCDSGLTVEREVVELPGITVIARRDY